MTKERVNDRGFTKRRRNNEFYSPLVEDPSSIILRRPMARTEPPLEDHPSLDHGKVYYIRFSTNIHA
eukprot:jgi/Psemu1/304226/fgenesh1_kg.139_\